MLYNLLRLSLHMNGFVEKLSSIIIWGRAPWPRPIESRMTAPRNSKLSNLFPSTSDVVTTIKVLKSDSDRSTVTEALARSLGCEFAASANATVKLQWRSVNLAAVWTDSFKVVESATTVDGCAYNIVLSKDAVDNVLRANTGAYVALAMSSCKKGLSML
jgi:hypothetical protein